MAGINALSACLVQYSHRNMLVCIFGMMIMLVPLVIHRSGVALVILYYSIHRIIGPCPKYTLAKLPYWLVI